MDLLIDAFEARPCLWDIGIKEYHLRDVKNKTYGELAEEMGISVVHIKTKWSTLRAQELRERAKEEKSKSGMGGAEVYVSAWQFMEKMRFVSQIKKTVSNDILIIALKVSVSSKLSSFHKLLKKTQSIPPLYPFSVFPRRRFSGGSSPSIKKWIRIPATAFFRTRSILNRFLFVIVLMLM